MSDAINTADATKSVSKTGAGSDQWRNARKALPWRRWLFAYDGFNLATNTLFTSAIWVIYLASRGYSPLAIGLFEMLFHVAKLVAEVPTGIFADLVGRRRSLIIFCILGGVENLLFLVPTVPLLILSFSLSGVSYAFLGGASEAMLWMLAGHQHLHQPALPGRTARHRPFAEYGPVQCGHDCALPALRPGHHEHSLQRCLPVDSRRAVDRQRRNIRIGIRPRTTYP